MEVLVVAIDADRRRDDLAGRQRRTVVDGHDADAVDHHLLVGIQRVGRLDRAADDHGVESLVLVQLVLPVDERLELLGSAGFEAIDRVFGHHREQGGVDRVDAFADDRPLPSALAPHRLVVRADLLAAQEPPRVLEIVAAHDLAQRLARQQRLAVAGIDIADLALRHRDQRRFVNAVLPPPQAEMQPTTQDLGLKPCLAVQSDDSPFRHRPFHRPQLFDDADPVVGDITHTRKLGCNRHDQKRGHDPEHARRECPRARPEAASQPSELIAPDRDATCSTNSEPTAMTSQ